MRLASAVLLYCSADSHMRQGSIQEIPDYVY